MSTPRADADPRELALQLAVVADRLDVRSTRAVDRMDAACAALERASAAVAARRDSESRQFVAAQRAAAEARIRLLWLASGALLIGALVAVAGATLAVTSAKRELTSIKRDQVLLEAVNAADLTLCGDRLCARLERGGSGSLENGEYQAIARR